MKSTNEILEYEAILLDILRRKAAKYIHTWNEAELRDNFISPLITLMDFNDSTVGMKAFSERDIQTKINKIHLKGRVEWMVAFGIDEPIIPFFFLPEYKSAFPSSQTGTGIGQVLASMVVAQNLNQHLPVTPSPNILPTSSNIPTSIHQLKPHLIASVFFKIKFSSTHHMAYFQLDAFVFSLDIIDLI